MRRARQSCLAASGCALAPAILIAVAWVVTQDASPVGHFRTPVEKGIEIVENLRGHTSGLAVPQFVIDAPGGGGKIPVNPQYVTGREGKRWKLRNYAGKPYEYEEP